MKNEDRFINFLRTGSINVLKLGAHVTDIRYKLGTPDDYSLEKKKENSIHSYYARFLQIGYDRGFVSWFGIYFRYLDNNSNMKYILDCYIPINKGTTLNELLKIIKNGKIDFRENNKLSSDDITAYNIGTNVIAFFQNGKIDSIQISNYR